MKAVLARVSAVLLVGAAVMVLSSLPASAIDNCSPKNWCFPDPTITSGATLYFKGVTVVKAEESDPGDEVRIYVELEGAIGTGKLVFKADDMYTGKTSVLVTPAAISFKDAALIRAFEADGSALTPVGEVEVFPEDKGTQFFYEVSNRAGTIYQLLFRVA